MVKKKVKSDDSGLFIPAGVLLGLGIGGLFGAWGQGVLIGIGVGFLAMAIVRIKK